MFINKVKELLVNVARNKTQATYWKFGFVPLPWVRKRNSKSL